MIRYRFVFVLVIVLNMAGLVAAAENETSTQPPVDSQALKLWYAQPATEWIEAMPIGNGRLGAMAYGGVQQEHLQLNEDTRWSGGPHSYDNPDAYSHLATVREQLDRGEYRDAEEDERLSSNGLSQQLELPTVTVKHTAVEGIGVEAGVMRRDPSDIIKVSDQYYVWYSKGKISPGYDATLWYATSLDGKQWTEQGMALSKGEPGSWEGASVFTPNILVAEGRYWLFYTGTSKEFKKKPFNPDSKIGVAVADSPEGPWERVADNPVLRNSDTREEFDSHLIDDACLIVRDGKYWLYYKGRQLGKSPGQTQMGLAIADQPQGPYVKHEANPVIPGNHEVLVWPHGSGVAAMIGTTGPKEITNSILCSEDGIHFSKTHVVKKGPWAGGTYRPEAFTDSGVGGIPKWGVEIGRQKKQLPFIQRFDLSEE